MEFIHSWTMGLSMAVIQAITICATATMSTRMLVIGVLAVGMRAIASRIIMMYVLPAEPGGSSPTTYAPSSARNTRLDTMIAPGQAARRDGPEK